LAAPEARPETAANAPEATSGAQETTAAAPETTAAAPETTAAAPETTADEPPVEQATDPGSAARRGVAAAALTPHPPSPPLPGTGQPWADRLWADEPAAPRPTEPSWGTVLATTLRLWTGRRLANPRTRAVLVILLATIVFVAAAVPLVLSRNSVSGSRNGPGQSGSRPSPGSGALAAAAAARHRAAAWVAQQVNPAAVVACDPEMCGALQAAHIPASRLLVVGPGQADPLGSDVLVATAVLRNQFGARLAGVYAPAVLASFGSGTAQIEIRVIAPDGSAAYMAQLAAEVAARRSAGAQILHNPQIQASPAARGQLAAGHVDPRLLGMLVTLSGQHPVDIVSFGGSPGSIVSAAAPLRSAEITGAAPSGGRPASVQLLRALLSAQRPPYRPSAATTVRFGSRTVLRVEYPAPTPLGLLGLPGLRQGDYPDEI
jgi:hypothetical protein